MRLRRGFCRSPTMLSSQTEQYTKISSREVARTSELRYSVSSIVQSPDKGRCRGRRTRKSQARLSPYTERLSVDLRTNLIDISAPNGSEMLPHVSFISDLEIQLSNFLGQSSHRTSTSSFPRTLRFRKIFSILQMACASFVTFWSSLA